MITQDTLNRIRRIELKTRRLVENAFAGAYHTAFKGRGIAFDTVRPYEYGDDARDIDWNITARMGEPYIKQYIEERELTVILILDLSASFLFGTINRQKREAAAELGAVLALSAITNNDKVGLITFSDVLEQYVPPRKGRKHVLRLIRELLAAQPTSTGTDLQLALQTAHRAVKRQSIIFVISDFLTDPDTLSHDLMTLSRKHDVIAVVTQDPLEQTFPDVGLINLQDAETLTHHRADTQQPGWIDRYTINAQQSSDQLDALLRRAQVDRIDISPTTDHVAALANFFTRRAHRIKR